MKKLILLVVMVIIVYQLKPGLFSFYLSDGAFDENGKPEVWLFTYAGCGAYCRNAKNLLDNRNIDYKEYDAYSEAGKEYLSHVTNYNHFPLTVVGSKNYVGDNKQEIISIIAEGTGDKILTRSEQQVMKRHFYEDGEPMLVMYATNTCGYCKKMRQYFSDNDIDYTEYNSKGDGRTSYNILEGRGVPLIYVGYRRIEGANIKKIDKAISDFKL